MSYRIAPIFLIRLAGVPFDTVKCLATPETRAAARELVTTQSRSQSDDEKTLAATLQRELETARRRLLDSARNILPRYLIFGAEGMRDRISSLLGGNADTAVPTRNSRTRERERHLVLYLQRIAAKNDTFSEFGPSGWGTIAKNVSGVTFAPEPGIAKREAFLERWIAHAIAAAINSDPENSNSKLAVPALEPHAVEILLDDVENWLPSAARDRWLPILRALIELPLKFAGTTDLQDRQSIVDKRKRHSNRSAPDQNRPIDFFTLPRIRSAKNVFASATSKLMRS